MVTVEGKASILLAGPELPFLADLAERLGKLGFAVERVPGAELAARLTAPAAPTSASAALVRFAMPYVTLPY